MSEPKFLVFRGSVEEYDRLDDAEEHAAELAGAEESSYTVLRVDGDWKQCALRIRYVGVIAEAYDEGEL